MRILLRWSDAVLSIMIVWGNPGVSLHGDVKPGFRNIVHIHNAPLARAHARGVQEEDRMLNVEADIGAQGGVHADCAGLEQLPVARSL